MPDHPILLLYSYKALFCNYSEFESLQLLRVAAPLIASESGTRNSTIGVRSGIRIEHSSSNQNGRTNGGTHGQDGPSKRAAAAMDAPAGAPYRPEEKGDRGAR